MTPEQTNPAPAEIVAVQESEVADLSQFLIEAFNVPETGRSALTPEALRWRYFEPRGAWPGPRSLAVREAGRFTAHTGAVTTAFVVPGRPEFNVTAAHPVDWIATRESGKMGVLLMLKVSGRAEVQYTLGSTLAGESIFERSGFKRVCVMPQFYRFFKPLKREVRNLIHGPQGFPKNVAMFGLDMTRSLVGRLARQDTSKLKLRAVNEFTAEVGALFHSRPQNFICSSRSADLLNYHLRHPGKTFRGWMLERDGQSVGFALTHIIERDQLRQGKIADCFLAEEDSSLWNGAVALLTEYLQQAGCDLARTAGTAPQFQSALRANGFFPRGRSSFLLRDLRNRLPKETPFHLTLIEGDMSY